jgi:hypothetical protein
LITKDKGIVESGLVETIWVLKGLKVCRFWFKVLQMIF